jgi:hypothetical protein
MRVIGIITTSVVALVVAVGAAIGVRSIPDLRRYLRIRSM